MERVARRGAFTDPHERYIVGEKFLADLQLLTRSNERFPFGARPVGCLEQQDFSRSPGGPTKLEASRDHTRFVDDQ